MKVIITERVTSELLHFESIINESILFISWTSTIAYQTRANEINLFSFMRHQENKNLLSTLEWLSHFVLNYRSVSGSHQFEIQNELGGISAKVYMASSTSHQVEHIDTFDKNDNRVEMQLYDKHSTRQMFTYDENGTPVTSKFSSHDGTIQITFYWISQNRKLENVGMSLQQENHEQFYNSYWDWQIEQFKLLIGDCLNVSEVISYEAPLLSLDVPTKRITKNELEKILSISSYQQNKKSNFWIVDFDHQNHWKPRTDIVKAATSIDNRIFKKMSFSSPYIDEEDWIRNQLKNYESLIFPGDVIIWQYPKYSPKLELAVIKWAKKRNILIVALVHDVTMIRTDTNKLKKYNLETDKEVLQSFDVVMLPLHFINALKDFGVNLNNIIEIAPYDFLYNQVITPASYQKLVVYAGSLAKFPNLDQIDFDLIIYGEKNFSSVVFDQPHIKNGGFVEATDLPAKLSSGYGLIWDEADNDPYLQQYTQWNWPYKFSLYMVSGLPVVAWRESAIADIIMQKNVGVVISKLSELRDMLDSISEERYQQMANNAANFGKQLAMGATTKQTLSDLKILLDNKQLINL
ncbi:glycosyl transferase [Leuconostoc gelidum subsp. aenigmaticum]|uniref:glycosyl transferase n=1 Tax=Leuconostoc gelidum TaxID=1244 RepID=UPI001CC814E0|nr:glycosyl transferase [Leuconostoc gelidum]MBZ6003204.1 glycosyl transferase [Leuconostoc gelidum subsp. aenigmaticum]